jgi:hypothetical protein
MMTKGMAILVRINGIQISSTIFPFPIALIDKSQLGSAERKSRAALIFPVIFQLFMINMSTLLKLNH